MKRGELKPLAGRQARLETGLPLAVPALLLGGAGLALAVPGLRTAAFLARAVRGRAGDSVAGEIPALQVTASLAAKVVVDEAVRALMVGLTGCPGSRQRQRIRHEVSEALALFTERGWLERPERFHRKPPAPVRIRLNARHAAGLDFHHLEVDSEYVPRSCEPGRDRWLGLRANRTAHAWILKHAGRSRPWLVAVPGFRMGTPRVDLTGLRAAYYHYDLGFNVAIPVLPLHGPRSAGRRSGDGFISADTLNTIHAEAQAMWDLRRLLAWIRGQGATGIAVLGVSLGGYNTALLASLERGLSCAIAGIPAACFASLLELHAPRALVWLGERLGLPWQDMRAITRVVSPLAIKPKIARHRRFLFAGLADRLIPPEHVAALWEHWQRPRIAWFAGSHLSFRWEPSVRTLIAEAFVDSGLLAARPPDAPRSRCVA